MMRNYVGMLMIFDLQLLQRITAELRVDLLSQHQKKVEKVVLVVATYFKKGCF